MISHRVGNDRVLFADACKNGVYYLKIFCFTDYSNGGYPGHLKLYKTEQLGSNLQTLVYDLAMFTSWFNHCCEGK